MQIRCSAGSFRSLQWLKQQWSFWFPLWSVLLILFENFQSLLVLFLSKKSQCLHFPDADSSHHWSEAVPEIYPAVYNYPQRIHSILSDPHCTRRTDPILWNFRLCLISLSCLFLYENVQSYPQHSSHFLFHMLMLSLPSFYHMVWPSSLLSQMILFLSYLVNFLIHDLPVYNRLYHFLDPPIYQTVRSVCFWYSLIDPVHPDWSYYPLSMPCYGSCWVHISLTGSWRSSQVWSIPC